MENSLPVLDHIGLWCSDLETSATRFESLLDVAAEPGGRHDGQGTWNKLVGANGGTYLELIGRDPEQTSVGSIIEAVGDQADLTSCLVAFRTADLESVHARALEVGATSHGVQSMSRAGADGATISWRLLFIRHVDHPILPFFIDWQSTPHPSSRLKPSLSLSPPIFQSPHPEPMQRLLKHLGVTAQTVYGEEHEMFFSLGNGTVSASASRNRSLSIDGNEPRDNQIGP